MTLGQQLKDFRKKRKMSQVYLSKLSGVSQSTIWRAEHDKEIKSYTLEALLASMKAKILIIDKDL